MSDKHNEIMDIINNMLAAPRGPEILLAGLALLCRTDPEAQAQVLAETIADPQEVARIVEAFELPDPVTSAAASGAKA